MEFLLSTRLGTSVGRVGTRTPGWTTPARGLRIRGDVDLTHHVNAGAAARAASGEAVVVDLSAAHAWGTVLPSGFSMDAHGQACAIARPQGQCQPKATGVRGRRLLLPDDHVTTLGGMRITTPERTWADCAAFMGWTDTVAMGDHLLRSGLASLESMGRMVAWCRGRRGVVNLRRALAVLDPGSESAGESWTRARLLDAGIPRPVCNPVVELVGRTCRLDMAWLAERVAVEYDGEEYHDDQHAAHDARRRTELADAGWIVVVVRKEDFAHFDDVIDAVRSALAGRAL